MPLILATVEIVGCIVVQLRGALVMKSQPKILEFRDHLIKFLITE